MALSKVMLSSSNSDRKRTVDDVWCDIVAGRRTFKTEQNTENDSEMMTLEEFLVKAGAEEHPQAQAVKFEPQRSSGGGGFAVAMSGDWSGGRSGEWGRGERMGKRRADTSAEQRHRRMIKNRESAARSRERKLAYQAELESLAMKLEEENERLMKEKAAHTKERLIQLMESVVSVIEKRKPTRSLKRTRSMQW